jgi:hypothetical protein
MDNCKICGEEVKACFKALVLNRYDVQYYKCVNCGFVQTESPYWLDEAYNNAIANQDIGLLNRNLVISPILSCLITYCFDNKGKFIDYGGGYGVLTRIMRDKGYDFYRYDTYCENIFAKEFDHKAPGTSPDYTLLSSFEVFEHLINPIDELEKMLKWSDNIFFSTEIQPNKLNSAGDWWYIVPETGQHIAFYTVKSLQVLSEKFGLNLYTDGATLHLFTKKKLNKLIIKSILKYRVAKFLDLALLNKRSLLMSDYNLIKSSGTNGLSNENII